MSAFRGCNRAERSTLLAICPLTLGPGFAQSEGFTFTSYQATLLRLFSIWRCFFFSASSLCLAQVRLSHLPRRTENKNENENEKKNENVGGVILVRILRTQYSVSYGISAQILRRLWCRTSRDFRCVSRSPVPHQPHQPGRVPPTRATRARRTGQAARGKPGTSAHQTRYLVQSACTSSFVPPLFRSACATTGT